VRASWALLVEPRVRPLTDGEIRRCEARDWLGAYASAAALPVGEFPRAVPDFR
jgi:hypothetical protein